MLGAQRQRQKGWKGGRHQRRVLRGWQPCCGTFLLFGGFCSPHHWTASSRYKRGLTLSAAHLAGPVTHVGSSLWMSRLLTRFPFAFSSRSFYSPGYSSQLSLQTSSPIQTCRTAGAGLFVATVSPVPATLLKCQLSVWSRDNLTDQSGSSSFIIHSQPIQSLQAHGHRELSSMPPLIIRLHQRLFALSNQCLYNSALPP